MFLSVLVASSLVLFASSYSATSRQGVVKTTRLPDRKAPAGNDFISKFFGAFLPTPEDIGESKAQLSMYVMYSTCNELTHKIGLTRYNRTSRPENYYATTDEWCDRISSDTDEDIALVRPTLKYTNLETRPLQLAYSANRDGWNAKDFHKRVDKLGPAVVLARTTNGGVVGGYNPTGWVNYGEYRGSIAAFLFTFPDGNTKARPVKVPKISGAGKIGQPCIEGMTRVLMVVLQVWLKSTMVAGRSSEPKD
jgi:hypothetical protein